MSDIMISFLAFFASIAALIIGYIVYLGGGEARALQRKFVALAVLVCLWIMSNVVYAAAEADIKYYVALASYGLAIGLVVQLLLFCLELIKFKLSIRDSALVVLPGFIVGLLAVTPGVVALRIVGDSIVTNRALLAIYGLVLVAYIISSCIILIVNKRKVNKTLKHQIDVILIGLGISGVIGAFCNLYLPLHDVYTYIQLGPASAVLFLGVIAYAIARQGLFSVKFAAVRTVAYLMMLGTLVAVYFAIATVFSTIINGPLGDPWQILLGAFAALILALIFHPIKKFFDRLTSRIFYQDSYNSDDFFARLTGALTRTTELRTLLEHAAVEIATTLKAEQGFFVVTLKNSHIISTGTRGHKQLLKADIAMLDEYVSTHDDAMIIHDELMANRKVLRLMSVHKIGVILPLVRDGVAFGYMCLGYRRSNKYTPRDYKVIETASDQLLIAIQNALSVQEIKELNATLQQRIDDATKELRESNAQLQRLDEAKDEFVSMASHQLRTPLTSVKGYISMVLEGDAGKISDTQAHLLGEAFTSSERMVHLINDFLNVSRLQTGKFMVDRRKSDLAKLTGQEVMSLKTTAKARNLKLQYRKPSHFPVLYIDEGKIRQVIMNFIDNAIYYSSEHSTITISLAVEDGNAMLRVHNHGIGVPKSEQAHLFSKFFRAENAKRQRPDGTGVGLYLAKKVITAHRGNMLFESTDHAGTTFGFHLPIKRLSEPPVEEGS